MIDFSFDAVLKYAPIIAITIAITSPILSSYFAHWWRLRKSLSYEIKTNAEIIAIEKTIREKFEIRYKRKSVANPRLFIIAILNDGRQSVDAKDFEKDIEFIFPDGGEILFNEISDNPSDLTVNCKISANKLFIEPLLLNKGDYFEVKGIINSVEGDIKCKARISGVKEVKRIGLPVPRYSLSMIILSILGLIIAFLFLLSESDEYKTIGLALLFVVISYGLHRIYRR